MLLLRKQDIVNINFKPDVVHCSRKNMVTTIYGQSSFYFLLSNFYGNKKNVKPLSANPTKWSSTLKQFAGCCYLESCQTIITVPFCENS